MKQVLRVFDDPAPAAIPADFVDFLRWLGGPALLHISGIDNTRKRALSVLVHGNETSGARALHRWLCLGRRPRVSLLCFVSGVEAALCEPLLSQRFVPGERDLNRCFRPPFNDRPGHIAQAMLAVLQAERPDCLVDMHNTSAPSPAFAIAPHEDVAHEALGALFCNNLVITEITLGALMESSGDPCPAITVECGATGDPRAEQVAWEGLQRYLHDEAVPGVPAPDSHLELFHRPVRLELEPGTLLAWGDGPVVGADLTVRTDLERFNFTTVEPDLVIGWLGPRGLDPLRVSDRMGRNRCDEWFRIQDGRFHTKESVRLFMVTSSLKMAMDDCLLYASREREHTTMTATVTSQGQS